MRRMLDPRGSVTSLSFSRDSQLLATTTEGRRDVYIWDVVTGEVVHVLGQPVEFAVEWHVADTVAFAPGADYLAVASPNGVTVCDTRTWAVLTRTPDTSREMRIRELVWDPGLAPAVAVVGSYEEVDMDYDEVDGVRYEYEGARRVVWLTEVWSLPGTLIPASRMSPIISQTRRTPFRIAFSNDGYFLGFNAPSEVEVWNAWAGTRVWGAGLSPADARGPICFAPHSNSPTLARGQRIEAWPSGQSRANAVIEFLGHTDVVHALRYTPDGRTLISASSDGTVRLWEASTGLEKRCFDMRVGKIAAADVSPDGAVAAVGGANGEIVVWDLE